MEAVVARILVVSVAPRWVPSPITSSDYPTTQSGQSSTRPEGLWRMSHSLAGMDPLIDPFGRRVTDLRLSITDRCNFRCTYCMPQEGMPWLDRHEVLTYEEQAQI